MAADQDRAERIGLLKRGRPDLTWRAIADRVDVSERAAIAWAQSGGIEYDNAKKLAAVFEVDVDYIMRGRPEETPDPFATPDADLSRRLDHIEDLLEANHELLTALAVDRGIIELSGAADVRPAVQAWMEKRRRQAS